MFPGFAAGPGGKQKKFFFSSVVLDFASYEIKAVVVGLTSLGFYVIVFRSHFAV